MISFTRPGCDTCGTAGPLTVVPVKRFFVRVPHGRVQHGGDRWGFCTPCYGLLTAGDIPGLARRMAAAHTAAGAPAGPLPRSIQHQLAAGLVRCAGAPVGT